VSDFRSPNVLVAKDGDRERCLLFVGVCHSGVAEKLNAEPMR